MTHTTQSGSAASGPRYFVLRNFPPNEHGRRYEARVADGSDTPPTAIRKTEFFVLDLTSDPHAPAAMIAYARACSATHPDLAADMLERFDAGDTVEAAATAEPEEPIAAATGLSMMHALIADDAHAATHLSLAEYRNGLLRAFDNPAVRSTMSIASAMKRQDRARIAGAVDQLRAALAAWPKSSSEICIEVALKMLQENAASGGFVTACDTPIAAPDDGGETVQLRAEIDRLNAIINTPQSGDFMRAVSIEAEHQRQRWSSEHDGGKTPADWFWLVGYLAGKGLHAHAAGDILKAEHHVITTAAALANWHLAIFGRTDMRPGIEAQVAQSAQSEGGDR